MSYRLEKNGDEQDIVIDGFEKGIADSPFLGIGNIRNLNVRYYEGVAYVNYKRQACTISGGTMGKPLYDTTSQDGIIYISDDNQQIWKQSAINSTTFNLLTGSFADSIYGIQCWNSYLIVFYNGRIDICGDGSGDGGITSSNWNTGTAATGVWPIKGVTITLTGTPAAGDTTATISTYTDAQGTARAFWNGPNGTYFGIVGGSGQTVLVTMAQNSSTINWYPALNIAGSDSTIAITPTSSTSVTQLAHMSLVSNNDGNLYFGNGANVGAFSLNTNQVFSKGKMQTFNFNVSALGLPPTDGAIWLIELRNLLMVAGNHKIYPWDRISPQWSNPVPIDENISKMINILNNVYILAGNKGNIYISNGYNAQRFKKIPDYISGLIDPQIEYGGIMSHRQNLWFQARFRNSNTSSTVLIGLFSLNLDTGALVMEAQLSAGLTPSGSSATSLLIDNSGLTLLPYDNYYSAYGANTSGIDYNNTNLWSSNEPIIETDIIPIGTFAKLRTFKSAEFKLDQPLLSTDSISLYARQSLSDSYTLIGTTNTSVLSFLYQTIPFEKWQWIQFKVTMSTTGASSTSSFIRLREIRIR